ncbi:MAG: hypothetical protein ACRDWY_16260 [Actinomycetes bacterium]
MKPSRDAGRVACFVAATVALAASGGCSAGFDATSAKPYAPSDGVLANSGDIRVLNALVVGDDIERAGVVSMTVANRGARDDRLTEITSPDATVELTAPVDLPPGGAVAFGSVAGPSADITGLSKLGGETVTLKLTFARAEPVTLRTVVVPAEGDYADLTPAPSATPTL